MKEILSKIYRGEYSVLEERPPETEKMSKLFERLEQLEDELRAKIPDSLKPQLLEFLKKADDYMYLSGEQDYITGFQTGMRLAVGALMNNEDSVQIPNFLEKSKRYTYFFSGNDDEKPSDME